MQLILTQSDIEKALEAHINKLGVKTEGMSVGIKISSTRNPTGYSAAVEIAELCTQKKVHVPEITESAGTEVTETTEVDSTEPEVDTEADDTEAEVNTGVGDTVKKTSLFTSED